MPDLKYSKTKMRLNAKVGMFEHQMARTTK